ncbi:MAG: biopolymer transporter ExbD [Candidatus Sumerlaeia bacterium]|nr:biopolymer transporter ExbD [Candidatus Sumerlaeia bacterium]
MAKKRTSRIYWAEGFEPAINLTPLLDCILNLVFFFILATSLKEPKELINITLPYSEQGMPVEEKSSPPLIITVDSENKIFINDVQSEITDLPDRIKQIKQTENIEEAIIRGDARAYHQTIVRVLDACSEAGLFKVSVEVISRVE